MRKIYKSCNTLPIARFFRFFDGEETNLKHLIIDYDYENDEIELTEDEVGVFTDIFEDIYYEYGDITENHKLRNTIKKQILIAEWEFIYTLVANLINIYIEHKQISTLLLLNELEDKIYYIDIKKAIDPQIKKIILKLKHLKNKIKIFKLKLAASLELNKKSTKTDLDKDALYLERNLELKRAIDPETTSVSKWVKMINMNKEKAKQHGRDSHRNAKS